MIKTLELLTDFIASPKSAVEELKKNHYSFAGFISLLFAILSQNTAGQLMFINSGKQTIGIFTVNFLFALLLFLVLIFIFAAWTNFIAGFWGAQANVKTFLSATMFSFAPLFLLLPLGSIFFVWIPAPAAVYVLTILIIYAWVTWLIYNSMKSIYSLNSGQALLIFASTLVFPVVFFIMFILGTVMLIAGLFS